MTLLLAVCLFGTPTIFLMGAVSVLLSWWAAYRARARV